MISDRFSAIVLGFLLAIMGGGTVIYGLNQDCLQVSPRNCQVLQIAAIASVFGGIFFMEARVAYKKSQGEWYAQDVDIPKDKPLLTPTQNWVRAVGWVIGSSLLSGLPIMVNGAMANAVFGVITGMAIDVLIRAIANKLPPQLDDE